MRQKVLHSIQDAIQESMEMKDAEEVKDENMSGDKHVEKRTLDSSTESKGTGDDGKGEGREISKLSEKEEVFRWDEFDTNDQF